MFLKIRTAIFCVFFVSVSRWAWQTQAHRETEVHLTAIGMLSQHNSDKLRCFHASLRETKRARRWRSVLGIRLQVVVARDCVRPEQLSRLPDEPAAALCGRDKPRLLRLEKAAIGCFQDCSDKSLQNHTATELAPRSKGVLLRNSTSSHHQRASRSGSGVRSLMT